MHPLFAMGKWDLRSKIFFLMKNHVDTRKSAVQLPRHPVKSNAFEKQSNREISGAFPVKYAKIDFQSALLHFADYVKIWYDKPMGTTVFP